MKKVWEAPPTRAKSLGHQPRQTAWDLGPGEVVVVEAPDGRDDEGPSHPSVICRISHRLCVCPATLLLLEAQSAGGAAPGRHPVHKSWMQKKKIPAAARKKFFFKNPPLKNFKMRLAKMSVTAEVPPPPYRLAYLSTILSLTSLSWRSSLKSR